MVPAESSTDGSHSRRRILRTGAAVSAAVVGGLAGCLGGNADDEDGPTPTSPSSTGGTASLDVVPDDVRHVQYYHVEKLLADDALRSIADASLERLTASQSWDGPASVDGAKSQIDDAVSVSLSGLREAVGFQLATESNRAIPSAMLLWTNWAEDDVVDGLEQIQPADVTKTTHGNRTVYRPDSEVDGASRIPFRVAVFGDGVYAIGAEQAVTAALDADSDSGETFGGPLRRDVEGLDGPVRMGLDVPQERYEERAESLGERGHEETQAAVLAQVSRAYGSVVVDGDARTLQATIVAESADVAADVRDVVEGQLSTWNDILSGADSSADVFADAEVGVDGKRVTVAVTPTPGDARALADGMLNLLNGERPPQSSTRGTATAPE